MVYPVIEENEENELKAAMKMYRELSKKTFPDLRVGLLHGRMEPDLKEQVMRLFGKGEIDILVSTTVIEVGVDVANATVMVIEHAERFGLAQLHQLRGRIGRGAAKSYCILMTGGKVSEEGERRLDELSPRLRETAELRLRHPTLSLRELGLKCRPVASKAAVHRRLQALIRRAEA